MALHFIENLKFYFWQLILFILLNYYFIDLVYIEFLTFICKMTTQKFEIKIDIYVSYMGYFETK